MKLLYKYKQVKWIDGGIIKMLMPSLIGIGVSITCLLGTTFAWFTDTTSTAPQSIESTTYGLNIKIESTDGYEEYEKIINKDGNYTFTLHNKEYKVSIVPTGTASNGYCVINGGLYTTQIDKNYSKSNPFTFTLYPNANSKVYTFTAIWGNYQKDDTYNAIINNGGEVKEPSSTIHLEEVNNNLEIPNLEEIEQNTSQPEEIESITPSEGEPKVEEDNESTESDSSDTEIDNSDIILGTTKEPSEESETDITNEYVTIK